MAANGIGVAILRSSKSGAAGQCATWLDQFTFYTGTNIINSNMTQGHREDRFEAVKMLLFGTAEALDNAKDQFSGVEQSMMRFEADLLPFFSDPGRHICLALKISPEFGQWLVGGLPQASDASNLIKVFEDKDFLYIDCASGSFPLGVDVEVQAIFARVATVISTEPGNVPHPGHLRFDIIIGRCGEFSLSRMGWNVSDPAFEIVDDDRIPAHRIETLLDQAKVEPSSIMLRVQNVLFHVVSYATQHPRPPFTKKLGMIPAVRARRRSSPHPTLTLFYVNQVDLPSATNKIREGKH